MVLKMTNEDISDGWGLFRQEAKKIPKYFHSALQSSFLNCQTWPPEHFLPSTLEICKGTSPSRWGKLLCYEIGLAAMLDSNSASF